MPAFNDTAWGMPLGVRFVRDFVAAAGLPEARQTAAPRPSYDPAPYNDPVKVGLINCYGYALQAREWIHVGDLAKTAFNETDDRLFNRIISDGLKPAPYGKVPEIEGYYLVSCWRGRGWHWFRQDADGTWSHKDGNKEATNLDGSGKIITNPHIADRGVFNDHMGNFYVPNEGIKALKRP